MWHLGGHLAPAASAKDGTSRWLHRYSSSMAPLHLSLGQRQDRLPVTSPLLLAGAEMDMADLKTEVRGFWDAASCGEVYAQGPGAEQQFRNHAEARYRLEPYIRGFARFDEGAGQDVLEIGVGMGGDHRSEE